MRERAGCRLAILALGATLVLDGCASTVGAQSPPAEPGSGFVSDVVAFLLGMAALGAVVILAWRRARCSHCRRGGLGGLATVTDYEDIARCVECRQLALQRQEVRLCWDCERLHVRLADRDRVVLTGHAAPAYAMSMEPPPPPPPPPLTAHGGANGGSKVFIDGPWHSGLG
jgi:hypothetical protein